MSDPKSSSTETAENLSGSNRTLSDVDSDLSDLDDSMTGFGYHVKKLSEEFGSDDKVFSGRGATERMKQNIDNLKKTPTKSNQVQTPSGPSSYYPEIINTEEKVKTEEVNTKNTGNTAQDCLSQYTHPNISRQARLKTRTKSTTELVFNKHTCVRKNTKRKPFNDKQISELEKEFQRTKISSPMRSIKEDFIEITPEVDDYDIGYQQQALSDENYVDLNEYILRNFSIDEKEIEDKDAVSMREEEELPPWIQLEYNNLQSYYGIERLVSNNIIFGTESVFRQLDSNDNVTNL